ncbi:ERF family protein [Nitratireductor sp. CAU 1489]|uniref:ERF family protein n=1 Tax=Nitratireductor arenosus TaxID=2682096 RepID=A0A844QMN8_9HYPH|nr:ERF family protein [Nitratireductor arenosus]MVA98879.1 ERF family protein [Nitratireductor arenosus]
MNTAVDIRKEDSTVQRYDDDQRADPFVQMIERVVLDPNASVDKLERMLALRNEEVENTRRRDREDAEIAAKRSYFAAMSKCQAELPVVTKNRNNTHTKSTYADLAAIEEQAMPIIHRYGFAVSFQPDGYNDKGELRILWEISHEEGHVRNGLGEIPLDAAGSQGKVNKTGTQAFGSTATYGRRYLLCMLFNISTGDDRDGNAIADGKAGDLITDDQARIIRTLIEETNSDIEQFCRLGGISAIPDMCIVDFDDAVRLLRAKKSRMEASGGQR